MKKYNVRLHFTSFVDFEVFAENERQANDLAEQMEIDMGQLFENLCRVEENNEEFNVVETPTAHEMKLALEQDGWDWNVLDMMDDWEIQEKYEEMKSETN